MEFGGLGGVSGGRPPNPEDLFEAAVERALGARMKTDTSLCEALWSALANQEWRHENGDTASYSFRAAGDLIAAVRGSGDYMDWYCCGPTATVDAEIAAALSTEGWVPDPG